MNDNKAASEHASLGDEPTLIADALRQRFGADAITVARIQYEEATEDQCRDSWELVLSELSS
jgi:hypothetical protein